MRGAADGVPRRIEARAILIAHGCAERCEKARTPVGARAAADADNDVAASMIERLRYNRPEAVTGGRHRSRHATGKPLQATDFRHFDNRRLAATGVRGGDHLALPSLGVDRDPRASRPED